MLDLDWSLTLDFEAEEESFWFISWGWVIKFLLGPRGKLL